MPNNYLRLLMVPGIIVPGILVSCVPEPAPDNTLLDGPIPGLTFEEHRRHIAGDVAFNNVVFTPTTGLGPTFVASSCGACHPADGRGHPSTALVRFGQGAPGVNPWVGLGGPQLQQHAIPGFLPEQLPQGVPHSTFLAPIVTGLGYLDAVNDATILEWADEDDADGDGVSGRPNWIVPPPYVPIRPQSVSGPDAQSRIGRFGRKAAVYGLLQQTAGAYNQDIGITSIFEPIDAHSNLEVDPEVSTKTINDVVFYLQTLKAPMRRDSASPNVLNGERLFTAIGCAACHRPTMTTGTSPLPYLSNQIIHPYSDLLLHDMGPELDDGYTEGTATTSEWRTTPLWGFGLSRDSQGGVLFLLHDGRAHSVSEAVEYHGGEGASARARFRALPAHEKADLEAFLESL